MNKKRKTSTAYLMLALSLIGLAGIHRFYLEKMGTGIFYLITWGWFGFGLIYDLFTMKKQVNAYNQERFHEMETINLR